MTVFPDARVYTAFDDGPYTASPTAWTEITSYVRSITTHRGRSSDLDQFDTGTAQLVLDNRARTFDPFYSIAATRTNLVPNPSFEIDTNGWTILSGASQTRITTDSIFSGACLQVTSSATSYNGTQSGFIPVTAGVNYSVSAYAKNVSGSTRTIYIALQFYTAGGSFISEVNSATQGTLATGSWSRRYTTGTAPATATQAKISLLSGTTGLTAGWLTNWDGIQLEAGSLGTYFDGGLDPYAYGTATTVGWTGTANNSASTRIAPASRINLAVNPSFETNLTGWDLTGTVNRVTTQFYVGTASAEMVYSGAGTVFINNTTRIAVAAGLAYTYSFYCKQSVDTGNLVSNILWFNSTGVQISDDVHQLNNPNTTWQRFSQTRTAPAGAASMVLRIYQTAGEAGGAVATNNYIDGILIEQAAAVADYFDGSTNSTGTLGVGQSSWTGTANGSTSQMLQFPRSTQLTPRRQIKITGTANSVEYDVFRGYVAGWPVTWSEAGKDSTVTIQCFDALGLMANEVVPTDWAGYYTETLSPYHYYKGNDSRGSTIVKDYGSAGRNLVNVASTYPTLFEQQPLADGLIGSSAALVNYWTGASNTYPMANSPTNYALCGWIDFSMSVAGIAAFNVKYSGAQIEFKYYAQTVGAVAAGTLDIRYYTTTYAYSYSVTQTVTAAIPHFWAINFDAAAQTLEIYLDNVNITQTRTAFAGGITVTEDLVNLSGVTVQEFCVFSRKLTATEIATLFNYGMGRISESTTARMQRLLDTTDWPAALESFPASPVGTVAEIGSGTGVVPELQLVADSEGGELYVSKTGVLTMTARRDVFNATRSATSQATFTDSGVGIRYGTELNIEYDADNLKNDITVNYSGDGEVNLYSDAVITGYGAAAATIETQLDSPTSALDLATLELGVEGVLIPQISPIDVSANTAAADWQTILGLELLDRVTFKRTPAVGNQFDRAALINAIDHQIEPGVWRTQLTLSMRYTSPLICDDPILGRVDYNYCG